MPGMDNLHRRPNKRQDSLTEAYSGSNGRNGQQDVKTSQTIPKPAPSNYAKTNGISEGDGDSDDDNDDDDSSSSSSSERVITFSESNFVAHDGSNRVYLVSDEVKFMSWNAANDTVSLQKIAWVAGKNGQDYIKFEEAKLKNGEIADKPYAFRKRMFCHAPHPACYTC